MSHMGTAAIGKNATKTPPAHNWRTTDEDEVNRRRLRAREEDFLVSNLDPRFPIFSNFSVKSGSGLAYSVEIRDVKGRQFACDCVDFRINGLGTCKHVEAVLLYLEHRFKRLFAGAVSKGSPRLDVVLDLARDNLRLVSPNGRIPPPLQEWFDPDGLLSDSSPEEAVSALESLRGDGLSALRISQEIGPWLETRRRAAERKELRRQYELKVQSCEWPVHETKVPLFPYQREGMLHLAFTERALLADEMGLGKTIQAIAACALLHRLGKAERVLVVAPASLKTEWEEQIRKFTDLPYQLVFGGRGSRLAAYSNAPFFTVANYEQMVRDALEVNARLRPDVVILDEAQRIKNWNTKTAQAVKRLKSRYAFVLTGTPIENRIDDLHSIMSFLDPAILGPLFRFNRDFYELDDRGHPIGYRNLDALHARIKPYLLRRRKTDVETELPTRTQRNHFVRLTPAQEEAHAHHTQQITRLVNIAERRPLTPEEHDKLQRELAMARMVCDSNYILDPNDRACPKLAELEKILEDCCANDAKVLVFSEWERMLELVRELCDKRGIGYAWHTGSVSQKRRRVEINAFKSDPECRVFLSTDSGATGLNLQDASVVVNCDLPWNPARLEQRIARAWRKNQSKPVTVINLISENTIEHRMLATLAAKQTVAESVLDEPGLIKEIKFRGGRAAFYERLQQLVAPQTGVSKPTARQQPALPADPALAFAELVAQRNPTGVVRCEERFPQSGTYSVLVVVVEKDAAQQREQLTALHREVYGTGQNKAGETTRLEIIDRETDETIQKLVEAGLIAKTTRASRLLYPTPQGNGTPQLSPEEQADAKAKREIAARKIKMATLLGQGGFDSEARTALFEAIYALAKAMAVESRLPEPPTLEDALLPPLSHQWKESLDLIKGFIADANCPWQPLVNALSKL